MHGRYGSVVTQHSGGADHSQQHSRLSSIGSPPPTAVWPYYTVRVSHSFNIPRRRKIPTVPATPGPLEESVDRERHLPPATPRTTRQQLAIRRRLFEELPSAAAASPLHQIPHHALTIRPTRHRRRMSIASRSSSRSCSRGRQPSRSPERRQGISRQASQEREPRRSPARANAPLPAVELQAVMLELSQNVNLMARGLRDRDAATAMVGTEQEDPNFQWDKLYQAPSTTFPRATTGQIQKLSAGLLAKLPSLSGRDFHDAAFVLTVMSDYPQLPENLANAAYQRLNLLYIATHHGWQTAIAASGSIGSSVAVFPPGFQPPTRRTSYRRTDLRPQNNPDPGPIRGGPRGRARGRRQQQA